MLPPRYTSLYVMWSDIAIGRATAWLMDHAAQVTAKVENVAALPFRSKLTRAEEAFGAPEPIHYFGPNRYLFHHQDAPGAETYAHFRDQEGQVTSPPLPPLVWHFGGPVSTDLGAQEETVTSLATIVVDAERDLHWPLQADGTVPEMPEGAFGIVPISDPRNSHTFGWFVLREQNGEDAWSLCPGFAEVHQHIGARASGPTYEDFDVMIETHARGTQTVDLPTAMVRVAGPDPRPDAVTSDGSELDAELQLLRSAVEPPDELLELESNERAHRTDLRPGEVQDADGVPARRPELAPALRCELIG